MGSRFLRPFLQSLCCNSPWNYAVFWKLKHHDEMILAWEDGFCDILKQSDAMASPVEDLYFKNSNMILSSALTPSLLDGTPGDYLVGYAITEMSHSSHVVGSGVVGEAAVKGNASWIYADSIQTDVLNSFLVSEYPDEWLLQFAAGIKTILLLPVIPDGVLQLGSTEMVSEDAVLVAYLKNKFELHKQSDGYIQQISPTSTFMDYLEEPSTVTTETVTEDQNSIHAVEDLYPIENQTVPVFMLHDLYNSSERHVEDNHENAAEGEMNQQPMGMIHVPEPFQLSYADYIDEISKYIHDERLRVSPYSYELNRRMCGDLVNELMDYKFEEGGTELTCVGNDFDNGICESGSNLFNFHEASGLGKAVGEVIQNKPHEHIYGESILSQDIAFHSFGDRMPSGTVDVSGVESVGFLVKHMEVEHLSKTVNANSSSSFDDNSSDKSIITSLNIPSHGFHKARAHSKHSASVETKISSLSDKQQPRKGHHPVNKRKLSRLSTTSKKRTHSGDNQRPRPRDRQLIQDRIKELRELVPNGEKGSIDGLLDKTIKHMLFLRNVTNQADKLRHPILEEEVGDNTTKPAEVKCSHRDGASWAVELGNEQHFCPIIVKDLDHPRHMLIEMVCIDHDRFLEIADVIHRLKLTILKGVMEKTADNSSWARFIVETSGSFHRLDIFWPLMQLQKDRAPISTST
ncbi:transcription factor LHW-like [Salvia splendens]|uniref:transcription factor LHW-like n=1 Tax=Salvia splendens TaxID=180675 RepID=UPI001C272231|nr:transcription factor LHW-like [Salvia splendens]XP_042045869.1 transcription factor LHW-like [Salvia splendens]